MIALIIVGILLAVFAWLIFWPWVVEVDTARNTYQFYQPGTVRFWLTTGFQPHLIILGISVPLRTREKGRPLTQHAIAKKKRKSLRIQPLLELWSEITHSITLNWFYLDLDTDDVVLNAQLVPVFLWCSRGSIHLTTNFEGRVSSRLRAELKLYRIGWAFLLFSLKNKKYGNEF